jgi:hypothetical protein
VFNATAGFLTLFYGAGGAAPMEIIAPRAFRTLALYAALLLAGVLAVSVLFDSNAASHDPGTLRKAVVNAVANAGDAGAVPSASAAPPSAAAERSVSPPAAPDVSASPSAAAASPPAPAAPAPGLPRPRLAAFVLSHGNPSQALSEFVASYSGSRFDVYVLHEATVSADAAAALAALAPTVAVRFVDVTKYFDPALLLPGTANAPMSCGSPVGYRLMCRFMSGPVYWLPEFDAYDQVLRFDDDSRFTAPIAQSLELRAGEVYAYALKQLDSGDCQIGFPELMKAAYAGSPDVVRFGANGWSEPWVRSGWIYNCNFEVASLAAFRSAHYREYWARINTAGLFLTTRLGDHQVKTVYVETFQPEESVVCYASLPYGHPNDHADGGPCEGAHDVGKKRSYAPPGAARALLRAIASVVAGAKRALAAALSH